MPRLFDNFYVRVHDSLNPAEQRNNLVSIASGTLFFLGWWILIDIVAGYPSSHDFNKIFLICGFSGTLALFMINSVSNSHVQGDIYTEGCLNQRGARVWLIIGFMLCFGSLIASVWILFEGYVISSSQATSVYPGIGLLLQNGLIFLSAMLLKFGREEDLMY